MTKTTCLSESQTWPTNSTGVDRKRRSSKEMKLSQKTRLLLLTPILIISKAMDKVHSLSIPILYGSRLHFCDYFTLVSSAQFSSVQFSSLFFGHPQFCEVAARGKEGRVRRPLEAQRQILCARVTCIQTHNLLSITSTPNSNHSILTATMKERYRHRVNVSTRNAAINLPDIRGQPSSWVALILLLLT